MVALDAAAVADAATADSELAAAVALAEASEAFVVDVEA